jgi:hypothetical protein
LIILSLPYNTSVVSEVGGEEGEEEAVLFKLNRLHTLSIIKSTGT